MGEHEDEEFAIHLSFILKCARCRAILSTSKALHTLLRTVMLPNSTLKPCEHYQLTLLL